VSAAPERTRDTVSAEASERTRLPKDEEGGEQGSPRGADAPGGGAMSAAPARTRDTVSAVLGCEGLCVGYQRTTIARDIAVSVGKGEILAVLGPNGAGKTTLLLTLAGFLRPIAGRVAIDGHDVTGSSARRMNRAGMVLVPDSRALFTTLSTLDNISIASRKGGATVSEVLDLFPRLRARAKVKAGMLSGGEQQMLAVARALVQGPRALLIDEMSMGLAPIIVEQLMPLVRQVADETGAAIVLVEQHVHLALEIADTAMVLVHGDVSLSGKAAELRDDPAALEAAYLGAATASGSQPATGKEPEPIGTAAGNSADPPA